MRAFPEAHRRFADRGVGLACMVDHPVATDPAAVAALARMLEDGRSSVGAQLHGWVNPPFDEPDAAAAGLPDDLSPELEAARIDRLTDAIVAVVSGR